MLQFNLAYSSVSQPVVWVPPDVLYMVSGVVYTGSLEPVIQQQDHECNTTNSNRRLSSVGLLQSSKDAQKNHPS